MGDVLVLDGVLGRVLRERRLAVGAAERVVLAVVLDLRGVRFDDEVFARDRVRFLADFELRGRRAVGTLVVAGAIGCCVCCRRKTKPAKTNDTATIFKRENMASD